MYINIKSLMGAVIAPRFLLATTFLAGGCGHVVAATVSIDSVGSVHSNVGDFLSISHYTGTSSSQGATEQIWSSNQSSVTGSFSIGSIISFLEGNGVDATPGLVFGFSANEKNNSPTITINSINLGFEKEDGSLLSFSLGDNQVVISDFHSGNSHAEAQLQIDLGFDILQEWNSTTSKNMSYSFSMNNGTNGPEKFFISNVFSTTPPVSYLTNLSPVPLPAAAYLFLSGLVGLGLAKRRK